MGKNKHSKDKIYQTVGELTAKHIGVSRDYELSILHRRLKFDSCCLTLGTVTKRHMGLCGNDSFCYVFECDAIIKFLEKYKLHPVTGETITSKSALIELQLHKNSEGKFHCPVLFKLFNQYSKIVAYKKSGHVISYEAYQQLNLKPQNFKDLITDEIITKSDVVTIQDPDLASIKWDVTNFYYVKNKLQIEDDSNRNTVRILEQSGVLHSVLDEYKGKADKTAERFNKILGQDAEQSDSVKLDRFNSAGYSDGSLSRSVTSTVMPFESKIVAAELNEEQILYPRVKKKGYVQMITNFGPINIELFCNRTPKTCHNFLLLASKGYYNNTLFHRLVKNFILQGGDPSCTGTGGESAWGAPFKDECHTDLKHSDRGILAMANSGPNSNKSQFYITLRGDYPHLDGKHTVFGKVVGGEETLSSIQLVEVDKKDKPKQRIEILNVIKYVDPFEEVQNMIDHERKKELVKQKSNEDSMQPGPCEKKFRSGVGSYINQVTIENGSGLNQTPSDVVHETKLSNIRRSMLEKLTTVKPEGHKSKKSFGDFSGW